MAKLRITLAPILVFAFAVFALAAQFSRGINMNLSLVELAARQPYAFWQALFGSVTGFTLGFRGGQAIAHVRHWPPSDSQLPTVAWANALWHLTPWAVASFLSHEGYQPLIITSSWMIAWVTRLLPFTRTVELGFLFGFATGYLWTIKSVLTKRDMS